jgi:phosphoribosylanthranilate isomerase
VDDRFDPDIAGAYKCDAYLLDGSREGLYGGSGETFPWRFAGEVKKHGPVIVSGGLDDSNVVSAIRSANPSGVDASSKLESKPGVKDHEKVRRYLEAARSMMMEPEKE